MILSLLRKVNPLPKSVTHPIAGDMPIRIHARAKHITLRFNPIKGFSITVPQGTTLFDIENVILKQEIWITNHHTHRQEVNPDGILFRGIPYSIAIDKVTGKNLYNFDHDHRLLTIDPALHQNRLKLRFILEREFKKSLPDYLSKLSLKTGLHPKKITVRDPKSRWGSCSSSGNISLSWRLIMTPPEVMEYVIIHELAHLVHMNHSKSFWQLVATHCPLYRQHIRWLKTHGVRVMGVAA